MQIFKDPFLNNQYIEEGYVKLKLLSHDDCISLKRFAKKILDDKIDNTCDFFSLPHFSSNEEVASIIKDFFYKLLNKKLSNFIEDNFELFSASFLVKKTKAHKISWHIDPSFYNQKKYQAPINIWAGINETTKKNGCLRIVPKSHKLGFNYEPFPLSEIGTSAKCTNNKDAYYKLIEKYAIDIPLKIGEVIIHNHSLLHASYPNNSFLKRRIAFKTIYIDKNVDNFEFAYFNKKDKSLKIYNVDINESQKNISRYFNEDIAKQYLNTENLIEKAFFDYQKLPFSTLKEMETIFKNKKGSNKSTYNLT